LLEHAETTEQVIRAAIEVHKALGPGLLESTYESCLAREFVLQNLPFLRQCEIPVEYKGERVECGFRMDLLVNDEVIVELKSVDKIIPIHEAQLLTYLKLTRKKVGLMINFNTTRLRDGIVRRVL
jgi:GxxExxY protein